jgi:hypothetical protein
MKSTVRCGQNINFFPLFFRIAIATSESRKRAASNPSNSGGIWGMVKNFASPTGQESIL